MKLRIFTLLAIVFPLNACSSMAFFNTLDVLSEANAIKHCRSKLDPELQRMSYRSCDRSLKP